MTTPKQTVEAIKEILIAWLIGLGYTIPPFNGKHSQEMFRQIMALLNPVEKEDEDFLSDCCGAEFDAFGFPREDGLYDEKCLKCGKRCDPIWRKIPSPNEAPKGEAKSPCLEYPPYTHHYKVYNGEQTWEVDKCLDCGFPNPNKPPAPDTT